MRYTMLRTRPVNLFLDGRPFDYVFQFRRPTRLKEGQPSNTYIEEFIFSSERPKLILRDIKKVRWLWSSKELSELFTVLLHLQDDKK